MILTHKINKALKSNKWRDARFILMKAYLARRRHVSRAYTVSQKRVPP